MGSLCVIEIKKETITRGSREEKKVQSGLL